jgi:hypothetical protein
MISHGANGRLDRVTKYDTKPPASVASAIKVVYVVNRVAAL